MSLSLAPLESDPRLSSAQAVNLSRKGLCTQRGAIPAPPTTLPEKTEKLSVSVEAKFHSWLGSFPQLTGFLLPVYALPFIPNSDLGTSLQRRTLQWQPMVPRMTFQLLILQSRDLCDVALAYSSSFVAVKSRLERASPYCMISQTLVALSYMESLKRLSLFGALGSLPMLLPLPRMPSLLCLIERRL